MKKFVSTCCVLLLLPALTACGGSKAEEYAIGEVGSWTDGEYTQVAKGYRGDLPVTLTIKEGKMADIQVGKNNETPDRGGKAIATMPKAMLDAQSHEVDGVSGATRTSEGLKDAVARALEEASTHAAK